MGAFGEAEYRICCRSAVDRRARKIEVVQVSGKEFARASSTVAGAGVLGDVR